MRCTVCHELISRPEGTWVHDHTGDPECWTGDGATAYPPNHQPNECRPETCGGVDYDPCPWVTVLKRVPL